MPELAAFLKTVNVFTLLSDAELTYLAGQFKSLNFGPNATVVKEGDLSDKFFVIQSGFVNVTRGPKENETFITVLCAGDYFGEAALFHDLTRTANIQTGAEPVELLTIDKAAFELYLQSNPIAANRILYQILKILFLRLEQTSSELQRERAQKAHHAIQKILK